jgi:hypothetical protein
VEGIIFSLFTSVASMDSSVYGLSCWPVYGLPISYYITLSPILLLPRALIQSCISTFSEDLGQ